MVVEFEIPLSPSLNEVLREERSRTRGYASACKRKRQRDVTLCALTKKHIWGAWPVGPRRVTFVRFGKRPIDLDNLVGGMKQILDALVQVGLLRDDRPEFLITKYDQSIDRANPRTVVTVEA